MSVNIYDASTDTLKMASGRVADAYTKAQTDAKFEDNADWLKGKNLFNKNSLKIGYIETNGQFYFNADWRTSDYIEIYNCEKIAFSGISNTGTYSYYDIDKTFLYRELMNNGDIITRPSNAYYIRVVVQRNDVNTTQVENGSVVTEYEPYHGKSNKELTQDIAELKILKELNTVVSGNGFTQGTIPLNPTPIGAVCDLANHFVRIIKSSSGFYVPQIVRYDNTYATAGQSVKVIYFTL